VLSAITVNTLGHVTSVSSKDLTANDIPILNQNTTGNAGTVTSGVYTTGAQTIGGVKTFTSQIFLNGSTNNRIEFNGSGLGGPHPFFMSDGKKIILHPSRNGSAEDFAIGIAGDAAGGVGTPTRFWQTIKDSDSRFQWYAASANIATLTGSGIFSTSRGLFSGDVIASGSFIGGSGTASLPSYEFVNDPDTGLFSPEANTFGISTSGVERLRVNNIGNVGIGTSSPSSMLQVSGLITANSGNFTQSLQVNGTGVWHSGNFDSSNIARTIGTQAISGYKTFNNRVTVASNVFAGGSQESQIFLNGSTNNRIEFNGSGVGDPALFSISAGKKILLHPSRSPSSEDFAIGIAGDGGAGAGTPTRFWQTVKDSASRFQWYAAATNIATLTGSGIFSTTRGLFSGDVTASGSFIGGSGTALLPSFEFVNDPDTGMFSPAANTIGLATSGVERLRINNIGNVGIGTSTPSGALHVVGTSLLDDLHIAKRYTETVAAISISSNTLTVNLNTCNLFTCPLNASITGVIISNTPATSGHAIGFSLIFTADGTARSVTWPSGVKWAGGGTAPTLTSTNAKRDVLSFLSTDNGTSWLGFVGGQNY
jgi:hypothetical protein